MNVDIKYFVLDNSCLCLNINDIIDFLSDQCVTYRRLIGNLSFQTVRLCRTNNLELHLFIKCNVVNLYCTSDINLIKINFILYYNFCILQDCLKLLDTGFDISLLVFRCIILSVLGKVPLLSCLFDLTCNFFSLYYFRFSSSSSIAFNPA